MKRIIYLDYLRIFAILGVILIHLTSYVNKTDIYCKEFGRYAVPCFVMISGVLFLGRKSAFLPNRPCRKRLLLLLEKYTLL